MNALKTIQTALPYQSIMLWYGGKARLLSWIVPMLRELMPHTRVYVEPYLGGGSVWLALNPHAPTIILNDADKDLIRFYRAVQHRDFLKHWRDLCATPYARQSFQHAHIGTPYRIWIHQTQGTSGTPSANSGSWGRAFISRYGVSARVSYYHKSLRLLPVLHYRLQRASLHCTDALEIIHEYDSPDTVFYLDPPYPRHTRSSKVAYRFEADDTHHYALVQTLLSLQGKAVLSGYPTPIYEPLERNGWKRFERKIQTTVPIAQQATTRNRTRTEVLWVKP